MTKVALEVEAHLNPSLYVELTDVTGLLRQFLLKTGLDDLQTPNKGSYF
jgi:hypothetical protein